MANFSNLFTPQTTLNPNVFKPQTQMSPSLFQAKPVPAPSVQPKPVATPAPLIPKASASMLPTQIQQVQPQNNQATIQALMNQAKGIQSGLDQYSREQGTTTGPTLQSQAPATPPPQPLFQQSLDRQMNIQPTDQQNQAFSGLMAKANSSQDITDARANLAQQMGLDINTNMGLMGKPGPLEFNQGRAQVAQQAQTQREAGLQGLLSNLLTGRSQDISALSAAGGQANTQAQQQLSGLQNVAGLTQPNAQGYPFVFNPQTGKYDTSSMDALGGKYGNDPILVKTNMQIANDFEGDYQKGLANLKSADTIQNQIIGTLQANPTLNNQPLSAITNLKELLAGQISSGPQQLLSQQIAQYIKALGLDPATTFAIAQQQQGTLAQLLDSLRQTAQALVDKSNPAGLDFNGTTAGGTTSGGQLSGTSQEILAKYGIH